ncbi:DNA gyrase subunit B [Kitasatospora sp. NPDC001309]|uniref:DNA gyrase subunit B n=1 Tax=unclassified Kitasatospora TaxID=2633591 RepID=UPI00369EC27B
MSTETNAYVGARIQVYEWPEAVRKRPGMFVGSTGERGLRQLVFAVSDRAVNDVLDGRASRVDVTLLPGGAVRIADDGPGVRVDDAGGADGPGLESVLTRLGVGGHYDVVLGNPDLGPAVTNALASRLTAEVRRDGVRWVQEYACGIALAPLAQAGPVVGSGTTVTFRPDAEIFGATEFSYEALAERFRELAFLNRGLDISLTDERYPGEPRAERFRFPGGARDFVTFLDSLDGRGDEPIRPEVVGFTQEEPGMAGRMEVAWRWHRAPEQRVRSFANCRPTPGGGTHQLGFLDGVVAAVTAYARASGGC